MPKEHLIGPHNGYRILKSFRIAEVIYDVTVHFCDLYISKRSRTHDQMAQAARSGRQNIAEGSSAATTSGKTELKLTNVAKASLEELRLDYEDFIRQRNLTTYQPDHPALQRFKQKKCASLEEVRQWVAEETRFLHQHSGEPTPDATVSELAANAALSLINICTYLLGKQVAQLAAQFEEQGGFTDKMYRVRNETRNRTNGNRGT